MVNLPPSPVTIGSSQTGKDRSSINEFVTLVEYCLRQISSLSHHLMLGQLKRLRDPGQCEGTRVGVNRAAVIQALDT
jgi:hypothetical protein